MLSARSRAPKLRRPKVLIITRSAKRADDIWKLAVHFFRETLSEDKLVDFLEVLTVEQASSKLRNVLATTEAWERPAEMPWVAELRSRAPADRPDRRRPMPAPMRETILARVVQLELHPSAEHSGRGSALWPPYSAPR
jgi:hypothetical protein